MIISPKMLGIVNSNCYTTESIPRKLCSGLSSFCSTVGLYELLCVSGELKMAFPVIGLIES